MLKADLHATEKSPEESLKASPAPGKLRDIQNCAATSLLGLFLQGGTFHIPMDILFLSVLLENVFQC